MTDVVFWLSVCTQELWLVVRAHLCTQHAPQCSTFHSHIEPLLSFLVLARVSSRSTTHGPDRSAERKPVYLDSWALVSRNRQRLAKGTISGHHQAPTTEEAAKRSYLTMVRWAHGTSAPQPYPRGQGTHGATALHPLVSPLASVVHGIVLCCTRCFEGRRGCLGSSGRHKL